MTCVQTAATFGYHETVIGRPVTPDDVEPVTWAIIERGRATSGIRHVSDVERLRQSAATLSAISPYDLFATPTLTKLPRPFGTTTCRADIERYNAKWADSVFGFPFNISGQPAIRCRWAGPPAAYRSACNWSAAWRRRADGSGRLRAAGRDSGSIAGPHCRRSAASLMPARRSTQAIGRSRTPRRATGDRSI